MGSVTLENVAKSFASVDVIRDVSVHIEEGEFCVLIGPSGSGKSTLLRIIAGLEDTGAGRVLIGDRDVTTLAPKQRDIAMVFQTYALYPQMTVRENMGFALRLAKLPKAEIDAKVTATAKLLELDTLLERLPKELSGGQRQRVSMGRAIVRNPSVFLFDEPLSNLDAKLRVQVRGEIAELHRRLKTTSVYVTHDQIEAMTLGEKLVVLRDGRVEQVGPPLELYDHPVNTFVAAFLGTPTINLLKARVKVENLQYRAVLEDGSELPLMASDGALSDGLEVIYGIRPEHLVLVSDDSTPGIPAEVYAIENTGSDMVVVCQAQGFRVTAAFKEQHDIHVGQRVTLVPQAGKVRLFDARSEQRLSSPVK